MIKLPIAVQLYTLRKEMAADFEGTLKKVKEIGYDGVEFAGIFDKDPLYIKQLCENLGLIPISAHVPYLALLENTDELIDTYEKIGVSQIVIPYLLPEYRPGTENFLSVIDGIRKIADTCKARGMALSYHNHDFEFEKLGDEYALDKIYREIPEELLKTQLDTCWVKVAGEDPVKYLEKYEGRIPTVHLKDFRGNRTANMYELIGVKNDGKTAQLEKFQFKPCGYGVQNMPAIIDAATKNGAEWFIVEQDGIEPQKTAFESIKMSLDYLKSL